MTPTLVSATRSLILLVAFCAAFAASAQPSGDMTREQVIAFLTREAFQSEAEATNKWRRATLSQVQLAMYFSGHSEITALRDEEKARLGERFSLRDFNNKFLSYGSAPVRHIRRLMRDGNRWVND